jgi:acetoin utilization deacetylase AcuC-like enzyme
VSAANADHGTRPTGWVWHESYAWHDSRTNAGWMPPEALFEPYPSVESPDTKRRFANLVARSGMLEYLTSIAPRSVTRDELLWVHSEAYVERIATLSAEMGGEAGEAAPFGPGSEPIARLAAGGALAAVDAVIDGDVRTAYALVRPPGHHAERDRGRGFCLFANTALAAHHARRVRGLDRVAVVDWDVHHGNGTESAFYEDPAVLTISLHQDRLYPADRGDVTDRGSGEGAGLNLNVPLPPGSGRAAYLDALNRVVEPALHAFEPELIVVASGLDASWMDPTARMNLTPACFGLLAARMRVAADELCGGRLVLVHEGGYSPIAVPYCGLAILEELTGHQTGVPVNSLVDGEPQHRSLAPNERDAVARAAQTPVSR